MYRFRRVLSPGEGTMVLAQYTGYVDGIPVREYFHDTLACVLLVGCLRLLRCQISGTGNLAIEIICMGCTVTGNGPAGLCPGRCVRGMCMYDASDLREGAVKFQMRRRIP